MKILLSIAIVLCVASSVVVSAQDRAEFKPSGSAWALLFGDYFYKMGGEAPGWGKGQYAGVQKDFHAFQLRRLYFGYDYKMSPELTGHVLLEANDKSTLATSSYAPFIKQAYLEWRNPLNLDLPMTINLGLVPTPIFTFPERTWGYRSVEKEILDSRGISSSSDFGILITGAFDKEENYGYQLMVGNGTGTKAPDFSATAFASREKELYGSVFARLLNRTLTLEAFADYRNGEQDKAGKDIGRFLWRGFAAYQTKELTVGVEYGSVTEKNAGRRTIPSSDSIPKVEEVDYRDAFFSAFAAVPLNFISDRLSVFARYDMFNNDANFDALNVYGSDVARNYTENLIIAGVTYKPISNVSIMPNVEINSYKDRRAVAVERKSDVTARITFFYMMR